MVTSSASFLFLQLLFLIVFHLRMAEKQHDHQQVGFSMNTTKRPKKLDFNAPLISTRRTFMCRSSSSKTSRSNTAERVPFCWEQVPGKPKDMQRTSLPDEELPPPKPPPGRWHPFQSSFDLTHSSTDDKCIQLSDGCDADMDEDDDIDIDNKGVYSDVMDVFSLSEAIDYVEKEAEKAQSQRGHGLDGFNAKTAMSSDCEDYPSFIIQRFLPAATAIAASSVIVNNVSNNKYHQQVKYGSGCSDDDDRKMRAYASGCGLENLFTWRMKHKPCGIRSPVRESSSGSVNLKCLPLRGKKCLANGFNGSKS